MFATSETFIEFDRTPRRKLGDLNLTPLIDVLFILIIFFMLTTSFMRIESLELILPSASKVADTDDTVHLFIYANGNMAIGKRKIDQSELTESLARMIEKDASTKIMMLTADGVTTQQLVTIMDRVSLAGGRSLFVRKWDSAPPEAKIPAPKPPESEAPKRIPGKADIRDLYGNF
jgi:biopolymer transport protein ExbD